ncbi:hypothetical protein Nepgr_010051 [Nepenthes gracilis]|uniref:E3 ubiquitin-protein ligase RMA n=1 Tax=Nepenthes gracilis TaxID=150966 RepID=A0AAD3SCD1_NEPGR|nr:hypothetical protein Nepgr_010051 [Nepenthes gracilis]
MADQGEDTINLDLNLVPLAPSSPETEPGSRSEEFPAERRINIDDRLTELLDRRIQEVFRNWPDSRVRISSPWTEEGSRASLGEPGPFDETIIDWPDERYIRLREAVRSRSRRWRWRQAHPPPEAENVSMGLMVASTDSGGLGGGENGGGMLQTGEGSTAAEDSINNLAKTCMTQLHDEAVDKKEDDEKTSGNAESFFDCNICLDLAREPIVTCCGHLFCWPCIYRWLHIHSDAKECPVCKGEVTLKNLTPIYGRGNSTREPEEDLGIMIPMRPAASRVESLRQAIQRSASSFSTEEMIQRLGSRFDLTRDLFQPQDLASARDTLERGHSLLNRILTSRGLRSEQNLVPASDDAVDLSQDGMRRPEVTELRRLPSLIYRSSHSHRSASAALVSAISSGERSVEAYNNHGAPPARSQEQPPSVDDRDSFSSIAAVIHGESQTVDTAVEIDSMVSLSTLSSRRRNPSRVSDMDSGDSRAPRRRRLN